MALVLFFYLIDVVSCYLILPIIILILLLFYNAFVVLFSIAFSIVIIRKIVLLIKK